MYQRSPFNQATDQKRNQSIEGQTKVQLCEWSTWVDTHMGPCTTSIQSLIFLTYHTEKVNLFKTLSALNKSQMLRNFKHSKLKVHAKCDCLYLQHVCSNKNKHMGYRGFVMSCLLRSTVLNEFNKVLFSVLNDTFWTSLRNQIYVGSSLIWICSVWIFFIIS